MPSSASIITLDRSADVTRQSQIRREGTDVTAGPFAGIGIEAASHPAGAFIETDEFGATKVPGVWAAGNSSDLGAQVGAAAAQGARAAQHVNADLVMKDLDHAVADAALHAEETCW